MTETRLTEGGTFGPVFSTGVCPGGTEVMVTENIVEFFLLRYDSILTVEMTVPAANALADQLLIATGRAIPPTKDTP